MRSKQRKFLDDFLDWANQCSINTFMKSKKEELIHANALTLGGYGVLIMGQTGAGKSLLTLTLIERAQLLGRAAYLVADDYCEIFAKSDKLVARVPATIRGAVEIRGAGLFAYPYREETTLDLAIELVGQAPRYPDNHHFTCLDITLPCLQLPRLDGNIPLLALCHAIEAHLFLSRWSSPLQ